MYSLTYFNMKLGSITQFLKVHSYNIFRLNDY